MAALPTGHLPCLRGESRCSNERETSLGHPSHPPRTSCTGWLIALLQGHCLARALPRPHPHDRQERLDSETRWPLDSGPARVRGPCREDSRSHSTTPRGHEPAHRWIACSCDHALAEALLHEVCIQRWRRSSQYTLQHRARHICDNCTRFAPRRRAMSSRTVAQINHHRS